MGKEWRMPTAEEMLEQIDDTGIFCNAVRAVKEK